MIPAAQATEPGARAERHEASSPSADADLARKRKWFRAWEQNKQDELNEGRDARKYYHDKQWTDAEKRKLAGRGQQATVRNRIKRKIDFLVGIEQRMRRDPKAYPRTPRHEAEADTATAGLRFVCDQSHWPKISSEAMHDGLVDGTGVCFIGIEKDDPKITEVPVDRWFYDPRAVKPDFSDARFCGLHLWLDTDEAKERWPDKAKEIEDMMEASGSSSTTSIIEQDREQQWGDFENRRVRVVEFWEQRPYNGALMNSSAMTAASALPVAGWYYCYFSGDVLLEAGWSPYRSLEGEPDCPYVAWSPYIDEKGTRYGLVRTMKSIQDEINHSSSKLLHRMTTRQFFYKDGAVEDPDEFARQIARPDGKIRISPHAEWGKDIGFVDDNIRMQGEAERHGMALAEMENYGPNPGLVGQGAGVDGASGRALLAQRDSGMTELSPVFERHRDWKLRVYRTIWARIRQAWTAERWIRITDDEDSVQFVQLNGYSLDPMTGQITGQNVVADIDVDIMLDEGPDTITMNEELLQTLSQLSSVQPQLWKVFIELSNSPQKDKLFKMLDEAHQAMQPPPDPAIEMKGQELQARMQELQIKGEQDARKSQIDMAKAETDLQIANANLKLKELDIYQKQVEFEGNRALKVLDFQMRRQPEAQQEASHG